MRQDKTILPEQVILTQRKNYQKYGENASRQTYNWMTRKQNNYGAKYGDEKIITEKLNGSTTWQKELEGPRARIYLDSLR